MSLRALLVLLLCVPALGAPFDGKSVAEIAAALKGPERLSALHELRDRGPDAAAAVGPIIEFYRNSDGPDEFYGIISALAAIGPAALPEFSRRIKAGQCHPMFYALEKMGPAAKDAVPDIADFLLSTRSVGCRYHAVKALSVVGPQDARAASALASLIDDKDDYARWEALRALQRLGPPAKEAAPALRERFRSGGRFDRARAAAALHSVDPDAFRKGSELRKELDAYVTELTGRFKEKPEDYTVRNNALHAIEELGPLAAAAVERVSPLLKDPQGAVRESAIAALQAIGSSSAAPGLHATLDEDPWLSARLHALTAIRTLAPRTLTSGTFPASLDKLAADAAAKIRSGDTGSRQYALSELLKARFSPPEVLEAVVEALNDEDTDNKALALKLLAPAPQIAVKALPTILPWLDSANDKFDEDGYVRSTALETLRAWGTAAAPAVPALAKALPLLGSDDGVRTVDALAAIGAAEPGVMPALEAAREGRSWAVRLRAREALDGLRTKAP